LIPQKETRGSQQEEVKHVWNVSCLERTFHGEEGEFEEGPAYHLFINSWGKRGSSCKRKHFKKEEGGGGAKSIGASFLLDRKRGTATGEKRNVIAVRTRRKVSKVMFWGGKGKSA